MQILQEPSLHKYVNSTKGCLLYPHTFIASRQVSCLIHAYRFCRTVTTSRQVSLQHTSQDSAECILQAARGCLRHSYKLCRTIPKLRQVPCLIHTNSAELSPKNTTLSLSSIQILHDYPPITHSHLSHPYNSAGLSPSYERCGLWHRCNSAGLYPNCVL